MNAWSRRCFLLVSLLLAFGMSITPIAAAPITENQNEYHPSLSEAESNPQGYQLQEISEEDTAITVPYWGRSALAKMENATALLYAYDSIAAGISRSKEEITIYDGDHPISVDEMKFVFNAYKRDYTDHFWLGNSYRFYNTKKTVISILPSYTMSGSALKEARQTFMAHADQMLRGITDSMNEFEKELYLHDSLAERIVYVQTEHAHDAYGALVEGQAVCEGYAEALQYLLQRAGIQSFIAEGTGIDAVTGEEGPHAWNFVRIDGAFYQTDLTWNDQISYLFHSYFNLSDSEISSDHILYDTAYELPVCTETDAQYFNVRGGKISGNTYAVNEIAARIRANGNYASFYVTGSMNSFIAWLNSNVRSIAYAAGIYLPKNYKYIPLGKELYLIINPCAHSQLTAIAGKDPTCTQSGYTAYYVCTCGNWYADANAQTLIADHNSILLSPNGHDYTDATCTTPKTCKVCKDTVGNALGHDYTDATCTTPKTCKICKNTVGNALGHDYTDATCTTPKTCKVCKNTVGNALGHDYTDATCTTPKTCKVCKDTVGNALGHDYTDATCTTPKTCKICKDTVGNALGHDYTDATCTTPKTCKICKDTVGEKASHTDENEDGLCDVCQFGNAIPKPEETTAESTTRLPQAEEPLPPVADTTAPATTPVTTPATDAAPSTAPESVKEALTHQASEEGCNGKLPDESMPILLCALWMLPLLRQRKKNHESAR